ncbi:MAG: carboxypeptidase M32 [Pseudomonadales bacterium]|jgi:carboxypeptidase Taq|nr:carboxypeptidase M32 [Pseudomonadales bacterium]
MTTAATSTAYDELMKLTREASLLGSTAALVGWDQETMMPKGGIAHRSRQLAQLARLQHEMATNPKIGELLSACEEDADLMGDALSPQGVNVRELRHDYDRKTRLPAELVEEEATLASVGQHTWAEARKNENFEHFRPTLEKIVDLLRRKAECYGWADGGEPWDALAEDYEPGCTAEQVAEVFGPLRDRLASFIDELMGGSTKPSNVFNELALPIDQQRKFVEFVSASIGFDYERGRLDLATHPFCSGTHCNDVRLTTRFHENNVNDALGSTMHESGHGIYEQGLLAEHIGTPMGDSVSLGIHESQSRMWENQVGRSRAFWEWCYPKLGEFFGNAADALSLDDVYGAVNIVKPDFIRVEADEATYNMHPLIRFELERELLAGRMQVKDISEAWNIRYKKYLGLDVPNDAKGCLQDIHWSMTAMGYFPTYTLGNLYAAQFFEKALADMPDLYEQFKAGEFGALKRWLNENIHAHGRRYKAAELCEHVTGEPLSPEPLMRHLEGKLRPLYGL